MRNAIRHNVNYFSAITSLLFWSYVLPSRFLSSASDSAVFLRLIHQFHLRSDIICYTNILHNLLSSLALFGNRNTLTAEFQCSNMSREVRVAFLRQFSEHIS
jgi:hypothetical protein